MYCVKDYQTVEELKRAVEAREWIEVFLPGMEDRSQYGVATVEGPHGKETWQAEVRLECGRVVEVIAVLT